MHLNIQRQYSFHANNFSLRVACKVNIEYSIWDGHLRMVHFNIRTAVLLEKNNYRHCWATTVTKFTLSYCKKLDSKQIHKIICITWHLRSVECINFLRQTICRYSSSLMLTNNYATDISVKKCDDVFWLNSYQVEHTSYSDLPIAKRYY